jgi:N-acyl-D-aspartate/D-glutamate deacylase
MPRRRVATKREVLPDPIYNSVMVTKFINGVMLTGKKTIAEKVFYGAMEKIAEKMSHAVADCFQIEKRGYIREGYFADLVLVDLNDSFVVEKSNILYKCGWSPFEGQSFPGVITHTFVNGNLVYGKGVWNESLKGQRLNFDRS